MGDGKVHWRIRSNVPSALPIRNDKSRFRLRLSVARHRRSHIRASNISDQSVAPPSAQKNRLGYCVCWRPCVSIIPEQAYIPQLLTDPDCAVQLLQVQSPPVTSGSL